MKDYTTVKQVCILVAVICFGALLGINLPDSKPTKHYPIEVQTHWQTDGYQGHPTMQADSVKGDTIWRDGLGIVNKNIINIEFK
jgi:hypothetical protein